MGKYNVEFPFDRFPSGLKAVICYGSTFLPKHDDHGALGRGCPKLSLPLSDLIFVVDDSQHTDGARALAAWHAENYKINPRHYNGLLPIQQQIRLSSVGSSSLIASPFVHIPLKVRHADERVEQSGRLSKYMVVGSSDLEENLASWNELYLAGRLQKPVLFLFPTNGGNAASPNLTEKNAVSYDSGTIEQLEGGESLAAALSQNFEHTLRASLLLSRRSFPLASLLKQCASLSYLGDRARLWLREGERTANAVPKFSLAYLHSYYPAFKRVQKDWRLNLEEGDNEILAGRYHPKQYDWEATSQKATSQTPHEPGSLEPGSSELRSDEPERSSLRSFSLSFADESDAELLDEILYKTKDAAAAELEADFGARLLNKDVSSRRKNLRRDPLLVEAEKIIKARPFHVLQDFSNEAQCSLFHSLPDRFQRQANAVSARARLNRIINPFHMIDRRNDGEVLGGPLPWERHCIRQSFIALNKSAARNAMLKNIVQAGPLKSSLYAFHKYAANLTF